MTFDLRILEHRFGEHKHLVLCACGRMTKVELHRPAPMTDAEIATQCILEHHKRGKAHNLAVDKFNVTILR